jgi:hypothetical protein
MTDPILQFFAYAHLPEKLQAFSKPFSDLAHKMAEELPPGPEASAGLRKLLEAKDCFVRASLTTPSPLGSLRV